MRLRAAAARDGTYLTLPQTVRDHCLGLYLELDRQDDKRLLGILDAAEERDEARERDDEPELDRDDEISGGRRR